jgi:hypothetical protein
VACTPSPAGQEPWGVTGGVGGGPGNSFQLLATPGKSWHTQLPLGAPGTGVGHPQGLGGSQGGVAAGMGPCGGQPGNGVGVLGLAQTYESTPLA